MKKNYKKIAIIGAGSWGTTIAREIAKVNLHSEIVMWAFEKSVVDSINTFHENRDYLPGVNLPENIKATDNLKECAMKSDSIIIATPSKVLFDISQKISKFVSPDIPVGYITKGFCKIKDKVYTISQAIQKAIPNAGDNVTAIYGPSHAEELSTGFHTCLNIASKSKDSAEYFSKILTSSVLQCRVKNDIIGVEIGGTLKNPAAIAAGMISVLPNCGDNLTGALISEALKEMLRLAKLFKAKPETIIDISGLGDLVATALSDHSRNRRFGKDIGRLIISGNKKLNLYDKLMLKINPDQVIENLSKNLNYLAEGAYAIEPLIELAKKNNISIPVYTALYEVLLNKKNPTLLIETIKNPDKFATLFKETKIQIKSRKVGLEKVKGKAFKKTVIEKTLLKLLSTKDQDNNKQNIIIENLKKFSKNHPNLEKAERKLLDNLSVSNYKNNIENLVDNYYNDLSDDYGSIYKKIFINTFNFFYLKNKFSKQKGKLNITGFYNQVKAIKRDVEIIYVSNFITFADFLFIVFAIKKKKLAFPRFFVCKNAVQQPFFRWLIKKAGGFIVDNSKLKNIVYRETLSQYISTLIDHGVPILYFPENKPSQMTKSKMNIKYDFFSIIIESLFQSTIEISIVPLEVNYFKKYFSENNSLNLSEELLNKVAINFSQPIYLSEFTKNPHTITGISEIIKESWQKDGLIFPQNIFAKALLQTNGILNKENITTQIRTFVNNVNQTIPYSIEEIFKEGSAFVKENGIISINQDDIVEIILEDNLKFYARNSGGK